VAMQSISDLIAAQSSVLTVEDPSAGKSTMLASQDLDQSYTISYNEHYQSVNPLIKRARSCLSNHPIIRSSQLCEDSELLRSEFYAEWLRPQDLFYVVGGQVASTGGKVAVLHCLRSRGAGDFGQDEFRFLVGVAPHLRRAMRVSERLSLMETLNSSFDTMACGFLLFNEAGTLIYRNVSAKQMLEAADGLNVWLRGAEKHQPRLGEVYVPRLSGRRGYIVTCLRLHPGLVCWSAISPANACFVIDLEAEIIPETAFREAYGLTPAEMRMTEPLVAGRSLDECCALLCISRNTGRTHLRSIFSKVGVKRQSELVGLVARFNLLRKVPATLG
jgi:DNA-binding CsgD family transcriptional regulator